MKNSPTRKNPWSLIAVGPMWSMPSFTMFVFPTSRQISGDTLKKGTFPEPMHATGNGMKTAEKYRKFKFRLKK